ncbi:MAG: hypothetical protein WCC59_05030 [Terriglobales bacterium]
MKNLMARSIRTAFLLIAVFAIAMTAPVCFAKEHGADCSGLIKGRTYAQLFDGYINLAGVLPNAGGGTLTFHPHGRVTGTITLTVGLFLYPQFEHAPVPQDGTYQLAWDTSKQPAVCTGTAEISSEVTGTDNFQLVVSSDGKRVEMIHTNPGLTLDLTLIPMHAGKCSNHTLRSVYSYSAKGWITFPPFPSNNFGQLLNPFLPFAFSGAISFDPDRVPSGFPGDVPAGSAYLEGWDTVSLNGDIVPRTYTGWYKVSPDCTATSALVDSITQVPTNVEVLIMEHAKQIGVINTDQGFALAFTAASVDRDDDKR